MSEFTEAQIQAKIKEINDESRKRTEGKTRQQIIDEMKRQYAINRLQSEKTNEALSRVSMNSKDLAKYKEDTWND